MSYRVFTAFDLSAEVIRSIVDFQEKLPKQFHTVLRWTKVEQLHITLKFVGELNEKDLQPVQEKIQKSFSETKKFSLEYSGSGFFPNEKNPRILWIAMQPSSELQAVVKKNEEIFQTYGYAPEKRPFQAHITIGRFKEYATRYELDQFLTEWHKQKPAFQARQMIDHLTFYRSMLTPQGPLYSIIAKVNFL